MLLYDASRSRQPYAELALPPPCPLPQGTDTLANLLEGFRFILCAHPAALQVRRGGTVLPNAGPAVDVLVHLQ